MSEQPEFFSYTRQEFVDEFVHPTTARPWRPRVRGELLPPVPKALGPVLIALTVVC